MMMKKNILSLALSIFSIGSLAQAQPPLEALDMLRGSYDAAITATSDPDWFSVGGCTLNSVVIHGKDPVSGMPRAVRVKEYLPRGLSSILHRPTLHEQKTVIVVPPTGGENVLDDVYANTLCVAGYRAALVQGWDFDSLVELDLDAHSRGTLRAFAALEHVIKYLKSSGSGRIGILGTSVGAIASSLILGYDKRINTGFLIVGGGGMSQIIATSTEEGLTALRNRRYTAFGFQDLASYEQALRPHIKIDPLDFADFSGPKQTFFVIGTQDTTVPTENQWTLYYAFRGTPENVATFDGDHISTIVYAATSLQSRVIDFFDAHLK